MRSIFSLAFLLTVSISAQTNQMRFEAQGYQGHRVHNAGRNNWKVPYEIKLDSNSLKQQLMDGLDAAYASRLSVKLTATRKFVSGTATLEDPDGKDPKVFRATRDMPYIAFDEQGAAEVRAREVIADLLSQLQKPMR